MSPKGGPRRSGPQYSGGGPPGPPYSERTMGPGPQSPPQGPMTFTRALEVTDRAEQQGQGRPRGEEGEGNRESVYDMNYEISV